MVVRTADPAVVASRAGSLQRRRNGSKPSPDAVSSDETLYLIGRGSDPKRFLRFVRREAAEHFSEGDLLDEWNAAAKRVRALRVEEKGFADRPAIGKLGPEYEPLLIEFLSDPLVRHGFNTVPTEIAMVELDRLVVYQNHIDLSHVRKLEEKIGGVPSWEELFRICLPFDHPPPPVAWSRTRDDTYVFVSPSNDLRFLGSLPLRENQIVDCPPPGAVVGIIGLAVGFGSNFLNAVYAHNRLILNNGSHRAYALRSLGVTHVPCVVQHVKSRAELEVVAPSQVRHSAHRYFKDPRPAVLKDYFDPALRKVVKVHRRVRQVTVRFEVQEVYIPSL